MAYTKKDLIKSLDLLFKNRPTKSIDCLFPPSSPTFDKELEKLINDLYGNQIDKDLIKIKKRRKGFNLEQHVAESLGKVYEESLPSCIIFNANGIWKDMFYLVNRITGEFLRDYEGNILYHTTFLKATFFTEPLPNRKELKIVMIKTMI